MHISELDTPAVLVDLDVMERNLRRAQAYCTAHGIQLRPHMKTHKTPQIGRMQVEFGAVGLTCAKLGEAEVMADAGIQDLLIAYPLWGPAKLERLLRLAVRCVVTVVFDSAEVAEGISRAAQAAGTRIGALVEVDTGTGRCGLALGPEMLALCRQVAALPGLQFRGLMTYQGYIKGSPAEREAQMRAENDRLQTALDLLRSEGLACEVVSGGTSPSLMFSHLADAITENRSGTYVFNDRNMVGSDAATWDDCALRVALTVVSNAVPGQIIVDGGSKTFSSDRGPWDGFGRVVEDPDTLFVNMNEEHGFVRLNGSTHRHRIGDRLHVIPNHVCTCVNMHDELWVHRNGEVVDCWHIAARGKIR
jgi:D-serine deaminase-like pyridoxal phosphate-dependent protein